MIGFVFSSSAYNKRIPTEWTVVASNFITLSRAKLDITFSFNFTGYLPNFAILFLFSKSSFWYGFYLKNENEKFLFYLKYKENMCGSWFASQFTPPIPPPTNQPNAEIWHINVSVPKTKRWIIQIKNFHFCYQKNKTKHNSIFSKCKKVNQLMHFIFTKSTK